MHRNYSSFTTFLKCSILVWKYSDRRAASAAMWGQMDGNFGNKVAQPSKKVNVFDLMWNRARLQINVSVIALFHGHCISGGGTLFDLEQITCSLKMRDNSRDSDLPSIGNFYPQCKKSRRKLPNTGNSNTYEKVLRRSCAGGYFLRGEYKCSSFRE